jgi:hypothetical protein
MNLLESKVLSSLKWKKSIKECAKKLGITIDDYCKIKQKLISGDEKLNHYNLEKGEAKLNCVSLHEPKSPNEIIKILNIDISEWKLSQYWNKQMGDHWRISALITKINNDEKSFKYLLDNWKPKKNQIFKKYIDNENESVCGILSIQDIHFGKENNEYVNKDFEKSIINLIKKANLIYNIKELFFVIGGDILNMDTFDGTTTQGTVVDNSLKATNAYMQAFDTMHWAIEYLINFCNKLHVIYIPGNHDRLSSFHLVQALSKSIICDDIIWDTDYKERKIKVWGKNFLAFEHGDVKSKHTPLIYATEFSEEWGNTKYRTLFTGHYHQNKKVEYITTSEEIGFVHKTLPSLCKNDYYHYHNKYVGNRRSAVLEIQSEEKGEVCQLVYSL